MINMGVETLALHQSLSDDNREKVDTLILDFARDNAQKDDTQTGRDRNAAEIEAIKAELLQKIDLLSDEQCREILEHL